MDKEEKEVKKVTKKTTTTKKSPAKKAETPKKEVKSSVKKAPIKKETTSKTSSAKAKTVKKVTGATPKKKVTVKKEEKIIEVPVVKEAPVKEEKIVTTTVKEKKVSSELLQIRKKRYIIEAIIVAILVIVTLMFLCNRTFLKTSYKNDNIEVDIPRFSYYVKDKDNKITLLTLRKSEYLKEYYNEYLEGFTFYSCAEGNNTFYYNDETKTLIKEIKVEKKFAVKKVEIIYDARTPEEVCGLR